MLGGAGGGAGLPRVVAYPWPVPHRQRRTFAALTWALVATIVLSGCSLVGGTGGPADRAASAPVPAQSPPKGMAGLDRFYAQQLDWRSCEGGECATLTVPVDYAKPDGATIGLALLRVPARSTSQRIGSLVVNPGGPGGSGVEYAQAADLIVGADVRRRFDVVGFDPRGVGRSAPIECVGDRALDDFLGQDPTPDDAKEEAVFAEKSRDFATACGKHAGPLLAHVSTVDAAKDMDILRARLGERQLSYLGKSYGTFLGATYAGLFPAQVGRFVLDGVVAPDLTSVEINLGQARGFELATRTWATYCIGEGNCPLGGSVDEVMANLRAFLLKVDARPIPRTGDSAVTELTEGWASTGIAQAMYDERLWSELVDAMRDALAGNGSRLMDLANDYADRNSGGTYSSNLMQAIYAVNCLDKPEDPSVADHAAEAERSRTVAPTWGPFLMWSSLPCAYWPVHDRQSETPPQKITAAGAAPIVVVGTTRDPATPYEWAVRLRDQLDSAVLITYDGDGHTAYMRSNSCVDNPIDSWYIHGTLPKDGLRC